MRYMANILDRATRWLGWKIVQHIDRYILADIDAILAGRDDAPLSNGAPMEGDSL